MTNCIFIFEKDLFTRTQLFCLKDQIFEGFQLSRVYCFFLKFLPCVLFSNACKRCQENCIFTELLDLRKTKQKRKKMHTQVFRQCYVQHLCKISWKNSKPYFSWSSWKFSFFKQKTWFLVKNKSLSKITHQYFSVKFKYSGKPHTLKLQQQI